MEHARAGLEKIVGEALRRAPIEDAVVLAWPLVCGTAVSTRTRALDFTAGVLRVQVPDAAWRAQLMAFSPQYIGALNEFAGQVVRRITFILPEPAKSAEQA
jgi:Dna[CI] antecedent DciA-like protein